MHRDRTETDKQHRKRGTGNRERGISRPGLSEPLAMAAVADCDPRKRSKDSEEHERRVQENVSRLGDHAVFEGDKEGGEERSRHAAVKGAEGEVGERDGSDTHDGGHHAHRNIRYIFVYSANDVSIKRKGSERKDGLCDVLEVKVAVIAKEPASEGDE